MTGITACEPGTNNSDQTRFIEGLQSQQGKINGLVELFSQGYPQQLMAVNSVGIHVHDRQRLAQ